MSLNSLQQVVQAIQSDPIWADYRLASLLMSIWPEVVGEAVAKQTRPLRTQRQILQVATSTAAWAQTLTLQRALILTKLNPQLPKPLKDIRFLPGEWHRAQLKLQPTSTAADRADRVSSFVAVGSGKPPAATPEEAFERWQERVKQAQLHMQSCPMCQRPTPPIELNQWSMCRFCSVQSRSGR